MQGEIVLTQLAPPISRFSVPDPASLSGDIRLAIGRAAEKSAIAAFFGMSNRLGNAGDIRPNDEFYMLGRE